MSEKLTLCQQWRIYQKQTTDRLSYKSWLESQLERSMVDKAELVEFIENCEWNWLDDDIDSEIVADRCRLLKKHGEKYGGTQNESI